MIIRKRLSAGAQGRVQRRGPICCRWWGGHLLGKRAWAWELSTSLWVTKLGWRGWAAGAWGVTAGIAVTPVTPIARGVERGLGVAPDKSGPVELLIAEAKEKEVELTISTDHSNRVGGLKKICYLLTHNQCYITYYTDFCWVVLAKCTATVLDTLQIYQCALFMLNTNVLLIFK